VLLGAIFGLTVIVLVMGTAIWILRQPVHRYQGDKTPRERRSFRETMITWMSGPRG
jgi:hypothetical protein